MILTRMGYEPERGDFTVDRSGSFRIALTPVLLSSEAEPGEVVGRVLDPETQEGIEGADHDDRALPQVAGLDCWVVIHVTPAFRPT